MTSNEDEDDDFSPKDAFNMFTPIIYRPGSRDRIDTAPQPPPLYDVEDYSDFVTLDTPLAGVTVAGAGEPGGGPPPDLLHAKDVEVSGSVDPAGWIFGETTDTVIIPLVLSLIGVVAVISNVIVIMALVGPRRMRSGPNLLMANLAVADLAIVTTAVPTAAVTRLLGVLAVGALACRFVHYVIFVGVYVSMYSLVVVCVFGFFGELLRGGVNGKGGGRGETNDGTAMPLSVCSAVVSAVVIWTAFGASHLTFVVQSDVAGLAAFEEPLICVYGASGKHIRLCSASYSASRYCFGSVCLSVCASAHTKSRKLLIRNCCNLVGICPVVNARSVWTLVT